jgi:site-specific DNA recombinase
MDERISFIMKKKHTLGVPENTVAVYMRYSSHNQREESLDAQLRACREYAGRKGLQIVATYSDSAKSGMNADREEFLRMIEDSEKGQFKYLLVHKLDRFSRDKYDAVTYKRKLKVNGVSVLSVTENLDDSPESVILESLLEAMAQYYSGNLAREVMKGMKESAYQCTHLGGTPPLGYDIGPDRKYVVNEVEAQIVRTIFEQYASGVGYNQILRHLNGMGYRTKRGNPFAKNSLYSILENEKYVGTFIFNRKLEKDVSGKRNPQWKPREDWIVIEGGIPAIVDKETFEKVQKKLEFNACNGGRFKAREIYLLSGSVFCGECGSSMYGNTRKCGRNKSRYSSYRCSNRANHKGCANKELRKEYLENYVLDELYKSLFSECSIKKLVEMLADYNQRKRSESNSELNLAQKELADVNQKIGKVIQLVSESEVSIDTVKESLKGLEERKRFIEAHIREISYENEAVMITEDTIIDLVNRSRDFVKTRNIPECRNFIESYVGKVTVYADRVEVLFKIQVPKEPMDNISPLSSGERIGLIQKEYKTPSLYQ